MLHCWRLYVANPRKMQMQVWRHCWYVNTHSGKHQGLTSCICISLSGCVVGAHTWFGYHLQDSYQATVRMPCSPDGCRMQTVIGALQAATAGDDCESQAADVVATLSSAGINPVEEQGTHATELVHSMLAWLRQVGVGAYPCGVQLTSANHRLHGSEHARVR
jgi:hypothetical protein